MRKKAGKESRSSKQAQRKGKGHSSDRRRRRSDSISIVQPAPKSEATLTNHGEPKQQHHPVGGRVE